MTTNTPERIAVFVPVDDAHRAHLPVTLRDLFQQRDVNLQIVLLDLTSGGLGQEPGTVLISLGPDSSLGESYRAGLEATTAEIIAWQIPGVRALPNRMKTQMEHLRNHPEIDMLTSNLVLIDSASRLVAVADPHLAADAPTPMWQSGVVIRRDALALIGRSSDLPVELFLYIRLRGQGRTGHLAEPLTVGSDARFAAMQQQSVVDAAAVSKVKPPVAPPGTDQWAQIRRDLDVRITAARERDNEIQRMVLHGEQNPEGITRD